MPSETYRFGSFELDAQTGELASNGSRKQLREQPLQLLLALLEKPGELIPREALVQRLWPAGTFVDFDRGLNKAILHLREALGDSADTPQFIETLPRKGYRFIAPVMRGPVQETGEPPAAAPDLEIRRSKRPRWLLLVAVSAAVSFLIGANVAGIRSWIMQRLAPTPQISAVAVVPLENLSGDPEQAFFADGMTDALITELARLTSARVISRTTMLRYKRTGKSTQQIGRELNVDAIVEGTVLRAGDKVRITAQLIQVSTDNHLWAQSYERDMTAVLRLQQEVVTDIARRIGRVVKTVEPPRTVSPQAYGEYLKGRYYFFQYSAEGWQKAIEHYTAATQADPNFAPAYSGLAESYLVARGWNAFPPEEALRKGKIAAQKALELDPTSASAHLAIAAVVANEWDHDAAEKEFKRGLDLNPNDPLAWQQHGNQLLTQGRFEQAIAEQRRALSLDPFSPIMAAHLARAFYYSRDFDSAIAQAKQALDLEPGFPVALRWLEHSYRHKNMADEAMSAHLAALKPEERPETAQVYQASGYRGVLIHDARINESNDALMESAREYAQAGEKELALTALEECYRRRGPGLERLKIDPDLDPVRMDSRYQELLRQTRLAE